MRGADRDRQDVRRDPANAMPDVGGVVDPPEDIAAHLPEARRGPRLRDEDSPSAIPPVPPAPDGS